MDVDASNFEKEVLDASKEKLVVVDFWASWCMPCRMLGPILEKLEKELDFKLVKVNVDENQELAMKYGVMSIPSVKFFKNKELVDEFVGALPEQHVRQFIEKNK